MKILHLEDNPHDAELTHITFRQQWPDCAVELVDNRGDFVAKLASGGQDLILSDFKLVNFDGLEALRLAREKRPEVPFMFLSGTIGEDRAVEALRAGASDYVLKDRPKRLVPAICRVLEDARLQRERQAVEEQLLRVQRLENIGMLAAGIAHDFNNVLAPVLMAVPLIRERAKDPLVQQLLSSVEKSAERGAGLVRQILGFAHGVTGEPQLIQAKHLVRDLVQIMSQTFPKSIQLESNVASDLWPLKINPTQLHQVLLNLCVNARDAMPSGGTLRLRVANRQLDEVSAAAIQGAQPGTYVTFEVQDTGTGIPGDVLERIWEPFFTTKEEGRGTGLGLSTVRGIVQEYQGVINLRTQVGQGSLFEVFLPAVANSAVFGHGLSVTSAPRGDGELILVVDDDDSVRDVASAMLAKHGYKVIAAASGTEAIALFAPRSLEIRAVLTDISMPHLDGIALSKVVHGLNPTTRVVAMTGGPTAADQLNDPSVVAALLLKPFTAEVLLRTIHEVIARGVPAT